MQILKHNMIWQASEADMLGDFIRLVDYVEVDHLYNIAIATTQEFNLELTQRRDAMFETHVFFDMTGQTRLHTYTYSPQNTKSYTRKTWRLVSVAKKCVSTVKSTTLI
jgi:hypothetical protein